MPTFGQVAVPSSRRMPGPRVIKPCTIWLWVPAFAGMTKSENQGMRSGRREGVKTSFDQSPQSRRQRGAVLPCQPQRRERGCAGAFGEALSVGAGHERVMMIARGRQPEQRLEQAVDVGRGEQIVAADDVVIRHLRSRLGDESGVEADAISIERGRRTKSSTAPSQ